MGKNGRPTHALVSRKWVDPSELATGTPSVEVVGLYYSDTDSPYSLEIHYQEGSRAPLMGERVATWRDVSTLYVMAPKGPPSWLVLVGSDGVIVDVLHSHEREKAEVKVRRSHEPARPVPHLCFKPDPLTLHEEVGDRPLIGWRL